MPSDAMTMPAAEAHQFELRGISKAFGGVQALHAVDFELRPGEIHALVGENGAGKSTLIHVATGVIAPDDGQILIEGQPRSIANPLAAVRSGILAVYQEADLFADLSLAENMLLGEGLRRGALGWIDWPRTYSDAAHELKRMEEHVDVRTPAGALSVGRRVMAEIAAAVARRPRVLFLDEPTASLTGAESRQIFEQLSELKAAGVGIVYVSHRLEEVLEISDRVTVLRDGRHIATNSSASLDIDRLVTLMVGRETVSTALRKRSAPGEDVFQVEGLSSPDGSFQDVSLAVRAGEVVGLYGLVGSGRSELARALFGLAPRQGTVRLRGRLLPPTSPHGATRQGLAYVPEDRLTEAVFAHHDAQSNVTAAVLRRISRLGVLLRGRERAVSERVIETLRVKLDSPQQPMHTLSGGNQQKLVFGRWLETDPEVFILDEPTRGVDVGAKAEIHRLIDELAGRGKTVLLISSELSEVLRVSDRVLVLCEGRITGEFDAGDVSEDLVASAAFPTASKARQSGASTRSRVTATLRFRELGIVMALVLITLALSIIQPTEFATIENLVDVLTAASIVSIAAAGMTLVIAAGGIDISVGSLLGLVGAIAAMAATEGVPPLFCLALAVALGATAGVTNATICRFGNVHPIVVTLAGISIYRGLMLQVTGGYEIVPLPSEYRALADGRLLGTPKVLWYAVGVLVLNWALLSRTLPGRRILAVGNSEKASRLIGVSPWRYRTLAFAVLGACVGLASVLWGGYYGKIQSNTGLGWELTVIAATVVGGCSILGGRGTALGAFLGSVLIALVYNALILLKIDSFWQGCFVGGLILAAVLTDVWLPTLLEKRRRSPPVSALRQGGQP
jgi:rhamnose transport system ATP-binding protein